MQEFRIDKPILAKQPRENHSKWSIGMAGLLASLLACCIILLATVSMKNERSSVAVASEPGSDNTLNDTSTALNQHTKNARYNLKYPAPKIPKSDKPREIPTNISPIELSYPSRESVLIDSIPKSNSIYSGKITGITKHNELVSFTIDPLLQDFTDKLLTKSRSPHIAIVVMNPRNGDILALSQRSREISNFHLYAGLPAASLFKLVTAAAALESGEMLPNQKVKFRGGNYTLNQWNYNPDAKKDKRVMTLSEALGRSCNAVFSRVALQHLDSAKLAHFADLFGFNSSLGADITVKASSAYIPDSDYGLGRTAAGFGEVYISPIHAATLVAGIANDGLLPRPALVERIERSTGDVTYIRSPVMLQRIVKTDVARNLLKMMESTTTIGTSKKEFLYRRDSKIRGVRVAAKTGTLTGKNPEGVNHWFVAAAPIEDPKLAVAIVTVEPGKAWLSPSRMGRLILETALARPVINSKVSSKKSSSLKR